ncbi:MAG: TRAP transporter small permease subunit [Pseudomonadota bacterium]
MPGTVRPLVPAIVFGVFVFLALESYIEAALGFEGESFLGEMGHLWRPVFIGVALTALLVLLVRTGSGERLQSISDVCGAVATGVGRLASWIILPLIMIIMFDVITRKIEFIKIWNAGITETYGFSVSFLLQDFQWHLHGVLLLMTFGFGYMLNSHVRVDIFRETASRTGQAWVETIGLTLLAIPFMLVMIGFSYDFAIASYFQGEGSESMVGLGWRWIIKSFLVWGFCIALTAAVATLIRSVIFLYGDIEEQTVAEETIQYFTDQDAMATLILDQNKAEAAKGEQ